MVYDYTPVAPHLYGRRGCWIRRGVGDGFRVEQTTVSEMSLKALSSESLNFMA